MRKPLLAFFIPIAAILAACGGGSSSLSDVSATQTPFDAPTVGTTPAAGATCAPSPGPTPPPLSLVHPPAGSLDVPDDLGSIVLAGPLISGGTFAVTTGNGNSVAIGSPTSAPSPIPTPYATPSPGYPTTPVEAIPVPALSPQTTYSITYTYNVWANNPPSCSAPYTQHIGEFTTQSSP